MLLFTIVYNTHERAHENYLLRINKKLINKKEVKIGIISTVLVTSQIIQNEMRLFYIQLLYARQS